MQVHASTLLDLMDEYYSGLIDEDQDWFLGKMEEALQCNDLDDPEVIYFESGVRQRMEEYSREC